MAARGERGRRYDAVVIGSGPNGLAAAITLAERGRSVLVVEARDKLGGAVATDDLTLPGFHHDTFSAVYPAAAASPVWARMPLERFGLRWIHPPIAMAHPLPDGDAVALYRDLDRTAASLERQAAGDGERWRAFASPWLAHFGAVRATMLGGFPPVVGGLRLAAAFKLTGTLEFARLLLLPATALAAELFWSPGATAWLCGSALHGDVPPDGAGSAIAAAYLNILGHAVGWPSPEGGAGCFAAALVGYLRSLGGEARTGARVARVIASGNRVRGVALADGTCVATALVIADVTPHGLLALAGDAVPSSYVGRMRRYRYGPGTVKLDWALAGPIPWTADEPRGAGTVHVAGLSDEVMLASRQVGAGTLPARPPLLLGQQSLADPTRAPAGRHTAWAYTHTPRGYHWEAGDLDQHVERMEAHVERFAPGFRDRILARHVISPAGFEDRDANLVGGDVGGGSYALDQLVFRPIPALSPYHTPLRGLYVASASTFPGGAVHGAAGRAAARLALVETPLRRLWGLPHRRRSGAGGLSPDAPSPARRTLP